MEGTAVEIVAISEVGQDTVALTLESPPDFDARPGQFVQLRASVDGEPVTRHYSISSPRVTGTFEITVGIDPAGTLSPYLAGRSVGDAVEVDGPYGRVYYEDEPRVVVLASGPGIGPAVGVADRAVADGGDAAIVYLSDEPVHEGRLAALESTGAEVFVVGDEGRFRDAVGSVDGSGQWFVYGFAPFLETAADAMDAAGVDFEAAKVENFG